MPNNSQRICNWKDYNRSLVKRGELILNFNKNFLSKLYAQGEKRRGGQRKYSEEMYKFLLTIKVMLRLPWRATEGFAKRLLSKLYGVEVSIPDYAHANREARKLVLEIKDFVKPTAEGLELAFDSTGVNVYSTSGYHQRRYGKECLYRMRDQWKKIHLGLELKDQQIVSMVFTESNVNDCEVIKELSDPIKGKVKSVRADGAYDTKEFYRIINTWGAKALIPPSITSKAQDELKGRKTNEKYLKQRDKIIKRIRKTKDFYEGLKKWKAQSGYHKRSLIESCMLRLKRIFGFNLQHKTEQGRRNEIITKINLLNKMALLGRPQYAV